MTLQTVLKEALSLSPDERAQLADELWRSVPPDEKRLALTVAQADDLRRRIDEDARGLSDPQDWTQVRDSFRNKP